MKYGNRSFGKRIIASPIALVVCAVLLVVLAKASWNISEKAGLSSERLTQAQAEVAQLRQRQSELAEKVGYLSTENGIDTEIRTKYHAVKEGEAVAVIVDESKTAAAANASQTQSTSTMSWWSRVLHALVF